MTIDLSRIRFDNDFFETVLPNGTYLILNRVNESIASARGDIEIKNINIAIASENEVQDSCTSIIGMGCKSFEIKTEYKEYEGFPLTEDNMQYCTIEVSE